MKRCIKAHTVASFGPVPVGSLWADDSPFIEDESAFVDADAVVPAEVAVSPVKASNKSKGA